MEYTILEAGSIEALIAKVTKHIADGWRPQGGVARAYALEIGYCQAMVRG